MMNNSNPTEIPFKPYQIQDELLVGKENSLRDVILNKYIRGSILWLLGYRANVHLDQQVQETNLPIRPQQHENYFETAWTILLLVEAMVLFDSKYPDITTQIKLKVPEAVKWLLHKGQEFSSKKDEKSQINWEDLYDTAVIIQSLICARDNNLIPKDFKIQTSRAIEQSLAWLGRRTFDQIAPPYPISQRIVDDLALHGGESLAIILNTMRIALKKANMEFKKVFGRGHKTRLGPLSDLIQKNRNSHPALDSLIRSTITFVDQAFKIPGESRAHLLYLPVRREVLITLADILIDEHLQAKNFSIEQLYKIRLLLEKGIESLEELVIQEDIEPDTANRSDRLTAYLRSIRALSLGSYSSDGSDFGETGMVLGQLRTIIHSVDPFGDGSTYHSLYATRHVTRTLLEIYKWPTSRKKIIDLYDNQLKHTSLRALEERKQIYQLQQNLIQVDQQNRLLEEKYNQLSRNHSRLWGAALTLIIVLSITFVSVALILPYFGIAEFRLAFVPTRAGDLFQWIGTAAVLAAGLYAFMAIVIFRQSE